MGTESKRCFEKNCKLDASYVCKCTFPKSYWCELHFESHYKLNNRAHTFKPMHLEPIQLTKDAILSFLSKEKSKQNKIKQKIISSFSQYTSNSEDYINGTLERLDFSSLEIKNCYEKIAHAQKVSKFEKDPILKLLTLSADEAIEKIQQIIPAYTDSYNNSKLFYGLSQELERLIDSFIKDRFELYLNSKLLKIEEKLEDHDKAINKNKDIIENHLSDINNSISHLLAQTDKTKREFEDWKQELNIENKPISISSQISQITEEINEKLSKLSEKQSIIDYWIEDLQLQLEEKSSAFWDSENSMKIEEDFRRTCSVYENELRWICSYNEPLSQAYQNYIKAFRQKSSVYLIGKENDSTNLFIYDTESRREAVKVLATPEILSTGTCWAQIPNGELFCFGNYPSSGISLIIEKDCGFRMLPYGTPSHFSSAVYFNRNIYCFGGIYNGIPSNLSDRFDLDRNQWVKLNPLPQFDYKCNCIVFNSYILISGCASRNLWRYSIEANCFEKILFKFAADKRKLLINLGRLYLIECDGYIYESGFKDDNSWKQIASSRMSSNSPFQADCSFNKGVVYVGASLIERYFKFSLDDKIMVRI